VGLGKCSLIFNMMIFNSEPNSWQELQNYVAQLFTECGFATKVSETVELARGNKEIDVLAVDLDSDYRPIIMVECKYWSSAVKQETIHSFRTVVSDYGGNIGYIVSKSGFQAGSYEAVKKTNIRLVSLTDLEVAYFDKWIRAMVQKYLPLADFVFPYWDPVGGKMPQENARNFWEMSQLVHRAYEPICSLGPWEFMNGEFRRNYPMDLPVINDELEIISTERIANHREYFNFIERNKEKAVRHFKILYGEIV
jgi:hypothetical protein